VSGHDQLRVESPAPVEDTLQLFSRIATRLHTIWLRKTYPFAAFGRKTSVHYSCDIRRPVSRFVSMGDDIYIAPDVWLNVVAGSNSLEPKIVLGSGCKIGRRSTISSRNQIILQPDVLLAPSVLIMDHNHEFSNTNLPIHEQGVTEGGNSVVGANAIVTRSFPPFSVIAGNPAKILKTYDHQTRQWVRSHE
jgi:acetyltransferase-like isoleucine patch superfamily enzyme